MEAKAAKDAGWGHRRELVDDNIINYNSDEEFLASPDSPGHDAKATAEAAEAEF